MNVILIGALMGNFDILPFSQHHIKEAIKLIADKNVPSDKIIGKVFTIDQCNEAFEFAREHKENIKTVIEINKE